MEQVKGVNLGNWLVLEKWMNPALFAGTDAADEDALPRQLPREVYEARIAIHRSEYITERDFLTIHSMGLNTVRIPVPYSIFGDCPPFLGCVQELDHAFAWAEQYDLKILIDLHTVPHGQNGFDNGGISGVCKWAQEPESVLFALSVLERLANRYGHRKGLWGIEILNEPAMGSLFEAMQVQKRYPPADPELAKGSKSIPQTFLRKFYTDAYHRMRRYLPTEKYVVFHDGFQLTAWKDFMQEKEYQNVVLDTHQYLMTAEMMGCPQTLDGYLSYIHEHFARGIAEMQNHFPVICGEWCLFNSLACGCDTKGGQTVLNGQKNTPQNILSDVQKQEIYRALAQAQLQAWAKGSGYFYWSYKLLTDTVNTTGWAGWESWDFGRCVDFGWFPRQKGENN